MRATQFKSNHKVESNLLYFKKVLLEKRKEIQKELEILENKISDLEAAEKKEHGFATMHHHKARKESGISSKEINNILYDQAKRYFDQINAALDRIENGTYGICQITGKPIPIQQLNAVPHTRYRMEVKYMGFVEIE